MYSTVLLFTFECVRCSIYLYLPNFAKGKSLKYLILVMQAMEVAKFTVTEPAQRLYGSEILFVFRVRTLRLVLQVATMSRHSSDFHLSSEAPCSESIQKLQCRLVVK